MSTPFHVFHQLQNFVESHLNHVFIFFSCSFCASREQKTKIYGSESKNFLFHIFLAWKNHISRCRVFSSFSFLREKFFWRQNFTLHEINSLGQIRKKIYRIMVTWWDMAKKNEAWQTEMRPILRILMSFCSEKIKFIFNGLVRRISKKFCVENYWNRYLGWRTIVQPLTILF